MMKRQPICKYFASDQTKTLKNATVIKSPRPQLILNFDKPPVEAKSGCAGQNAQRYVGAQTALITRQETMSVWSSFPRRVRAATNPVAGRSVEPTEQIDDTQQDAQSYEDQQRSVYDHADRLPSFRQVSPFQ